MSEPKPIQLGLCCINMHLREKSPTIFCSRSVKLKTINEKGIDTLKDKIIQNLKDVVKLIEWNEQNGIRVLRLSSSLFPHKSNRLVVDYGYDFAIPYLKEIGKVYKKYNHRLTFHPGQYNVIGTDDPIKLENTVNELNYHSSVLDLIGVNNDGVMVIHGGGVYGDKPKTIERWCRNYNSLSETIRSRLVLENCERSYSIEDCLYISSRVGIPVVLDTHHDECYRNIHPNHGLKDIEYYISDILETWVKKGIKPKFHISEQGNGRCGHHSDYVETIPHYLLEIPDKYNIDIDIMIEAKCKEQAILRLYEKYPNLNCKRKKKRFKFRYK